MLGEVLNQGEGRLFPFDFEQVRFNERWRLFCIIILSLFLAFFRWRFRLLEEVSIKTRSKTIVLRFFHDSADKMFPLLFGLFDFNHMSKKSALYLGQIESIADKNLDPELAVLKG
jgi:hypothetical protein